ncbi:OmpA family protein [Oceanihabitans sp. IOP_32]|uniref:OmpA family protein n=1 Tax=Oceanihabitans sp. IOP_32 TaxID=2529032 RepID=UPI001292F8E8|nr:OmpA family protein [Oceanihabitans sp. IOP_32]QFZ53648.1 OmpA family protein [Oceanihabitans sp. IOP_32]
MKKIITYICVIVLLHSFNPIQAQKLKARSVKDDYTNYSYIKTSEVLLEVVENGYRNQDVLQKLANSFYFTNKMDQAAKWYGELFIEAETENFVVDPEYYFRYALALKGTGDYEASDVWMKKFTAVKPEDSRGKSFLSKVDYKSAINFNRNDFIEVENLEINSKYSDFGAAFVNENFVFASSRGDGKIYQWNEQPYLDLYKVGEISNPTSVKPFSPKINSKYHESSATFTKDGSVMYFTRNTYYKRYTVKDGDEGVNRLQLYRATLNDAGEWDNIEPVHFNDKNYSVAHPALNFNDTRLYFSSDMPGTYGQSDIFYVNIKDDGTLGDPINLGSSINSEGRETFPFVNANGDLFFSSDGFPGLGGLDIFASKDVDNKISQGDDNTFIIKNIGEPLNSKADDFSYYQNLDGKSGFFSSNREGGKGDDDIYKYIVTDCEQVVVGVVKDIATNAIIPQATIIMLNAKGEEVNRKKALADGTFSFKLECEKEYLIRAEQTMYTPSEKRFTTPSLKQELKLEMLLEKNEQFLMEPCADLAKLLDNRIIYFDFDKFNIRSDAEIELQKIIAILTKYPSATLDIRSHTDCRGPEAYNLYLSENRAQATRQYLIDKGISPERLTAKGYGESQLLNECACEGTPSSCSRAKHQENRRSEFVISSFKGEKCME